MADPFFRPATRMDYLAAVLLQTAADFHGQTDLQSAAALLGYEDSRPFFPANALAPPVVVLKTPGYVLVLCGSTHNQTQWIGNILGSPAVNFPGIDGAVSAYFGSVAVAYRGLIGPTLAEWLPGRRLVLMGFSLGAAAATILKELLANLDGIDAAANVYGPPRPGTAAFAAGYPTANLARLTLVNDPVGSVPPVIWSGQGRYSYWTAFAPLVVYAQPAGGETLFLGGRIGPGDFALPLDELILSFNLGLWGDYHNPYQYAANLRRGLPTTIPSGYDGFPGAARTDEIAALLFNKGPLVWPWTPKPKTANAGSGAMSVQLTVFFSDVDDPVGFTETYGFSGTDPNSVMGQWNAPGDNLEAKRLLILSQNAQIYAVRAAQVGAAVRNSVFQKYPIPRPGQRTDFERIECSINYFGFDANNISRRQFHFRGVPFTWLDGDKLTAFGEGYLASFEDFLATYKIRQGAIIKPDLGAKFQLESAVQAAAGGEITLTTSAPHGFAPNDLVKIIGCKAAPLLNGKWKVVGAQAGGTSFILGGSGRYSAPASINGTVQKVNGTTNTALSRVQYDGVGTKKCGKPAFLQRGRRSAQLKRR